MRLLFRVLQTVALHAWAWVNSPTSKEGQHTTFRETREAEEEKKTLSVPLPLIYILSAYICFVACFRFAFPHLYVYHRFYFNLTGQFSLYPILLLSIIFTDWLPNAGMEGTYCCIVRA